MPVRTESDASPGPSCRLGVLVPSSNSNAESSLQRMLSSQTTVAAHFSRFRLPASLDTRIDLPILGEAVGLLTDVDPDALAFHGTSGSWNGFEGDVALCVQLSDVSGSPATTATLAVREALRWCGGRGIGLVFPGPAQIAEKIMSQYRADGFAMLSYSAPEVELANAEIARVPKSWIEGLFQPLLENGALDTIVCIGTNLRSAYLVDEIERSYGVTVIDSATATLWELLRLARAERSITGWGRLLQSS